MDKTQLIHSTLESDPVLGEIVEMFVDEVPNRAETLLTQAASKDWESLNRTAHQLKGAFGSHGFSTVMESARNLEMATSEYRSEQKILAALNDLLAMCQRVRFAAGPTQNGM